MADNLEYPQSRTETILQDALGEDYPMEYPQSNVERILQNILGKNWPIDIPTSRIEKLLYKILKEGPGPGPTPSKDENIIITEANTAKTNSVNIFDCIESDSKIIKDPEGGLIPKLSSNTGDNGTAINDDSGYYNGNNNGTTGTGNLFYAFDLDPSTKCYYQREYVRDGAIGYLFNESVTFSRFFARQGNYLASNNISVTPQYTTDGTTWENIPNTSYNVTGYPYNAYGEFEKTFEPITAIGFRLLFGYKEPSTNVMTYSLQLFNE